jgi:hypothetical protein
MQFCTIDIDIDIDIVVIVDIFQGHTPICLRLGWTARASQRHVQQRGSNSSSGDSLGPSSFDAFPTPTRSPYGDSQPPLAITIQPREQTKRWSAVLAFCHE